MQNGQGAYTPVADNTAQREPFPDIPAPLTPHQALVEAERCYFCHDAPCVEACPTGIDIPGFIRRISDGNEVGAGRRILEANIFGGACARACPTEILCESACVRTAAEAKPVAIGRLQRYATDPLLERGEHPFEAAPSSGKSVAVVGAGPAGLSCAHRLASLGHTVTVFEARPQPGGLNEFGIAPYKMTRNIAQREVEFLLKIGGIRLQCNQALGREFTLGDLRRKYDAVFLGLGLGAPNALQLTPHSLSGVIEAVQFIESVRQSRNGVYPAVGKRVVVVGGGNTAVDAAVQAKRLGAHEVTIVYRRGPQSMTATGHEQEFAQVNGVQIRHWLSPSRLIGHEGSVMAIEFISGQTSGLARSEATTVSLPADWILVAIGQRFDALPNSAESGEFMATERGRIAVSDTLETSIRGVWAGGDCVARDPDLTVWAVEHGKRAALAIDNRLRSLHAGAR